MNMDVFDQIQELNFTKIENAQPLLNPRVESFIPYSQSLMRMSQHYIDPSQTDEGRLKMLEGPVQGSIE